MTPGAVVRRKPGGLFSLSCGCKDSAAISVSVSASHSSEHRRRRPREPPSSGGADTLTLTTASTSSPWDDVDEGYCTASSTPSFSGLLRQLNELEDNVRRWEISSEKVPVSVSAHQQHRRSTSDGESFARAAESVAVVKESEDPLGDFRRSMLQMIVEKEIVCGDELHELLQRFLSLNSPNHHGIILRAFEEIWYEVFAGYEQTPYLLQHLVCSPRLRQLRH